VEWLTPSIEQAEPSSGLLARLIFDEQLLALSYLLVIVTDKPGAVIALASAVIEPHELNVLLIPNSAYW